jgi:hypothetical protein
MPFQDLEGGFVVKPLIFSLCEERQDRLDQAGNYSDLAVGGANYAEAVDFRPKMSSA